MSGTKFWCLRTHDYITAIPEWALPPKEEKMPLTPTQERIITIIQILFGILLQSTFVYVAWNYGIVSAVTFAKSISFLEAILLTTFLNMFGLPKRPTLDS